MKSDIFDTIAVYVPEAHQQEYWRMVAKFRRINPDDEILNIILAMGILTLLLRELPTVLIEERKNLQQRLDVFREEVGKMMEGTTRQIVTLNNHAEVINETLEKSSVQFREGAAQIEKASRETVKQIDIDGMAQRLTARVEERVVARFEALASAMEKRFSLMEKIGHHVSDLIDHLREIRMGRMIAAISAIVVLLCAWIGLAVYFYCRDADNAALNDKLAQVEQMARANQPAFAALAVNDVRVEVTDVIVNGQRQIGQKALRITPSLGVMEEAPPDMEKSGLIRFAVPETFQDQIEHNQEEIERILRQFPAK